MRLRTTLAAAALAAAPVLAVTAPAIAAPPAAAPDVSPSVTYSEQGTCHNGSGASGPCSTHITIQSNPNNVGIAAWQQCGSNALQFGGWHFNAGSTSNTANCTSGIVTSAGYEYPKTNPHLVFCYFLGNNRNGSC